MELKLTTESFGAYEAGGEVTLTQEESTETIVPDYCPDIGRIVRTDGTVMIHSRDLRDGKAEVTGTVRVRVLYLPEGERKIRVLELGIPYTIESDHRALAECCCLLAEVEPEFLDTRMMNPRKLFTHCKLVCHLTGYRKRAVTYCSDVETTPDQAVEKRRVQQRSLFLMQIAEKDFTCSEDIILPSGRPGAAELLTSRVFGTVTESKVIGNKLIFKGAFTVALLYRTEDGSCCTAVSEIPFSQIMETEGGSEAANADLQLQISGSDLQLDGGDRDGRQIAVTLYVHVAAKLWETRELELLCDLYSTSYQTSYEAEPLLLTTYRETAERRQPVRETLEIGVTADRLLELSADCGSVSTSREGRQVTLRTGVSVRAMYLDENGTPLLAERCVDVCCQLEVPEECSVTARAICPDELQGALADRGIDVRFQVLFLTEAVSRTKRAVIARAELDPELPQETAQMPSLVLRCLGPKESLWELAKTYHTTISTILSANQVEREGEIPREKLLLIPRKRA